MKMAALSVRIPDELKNKASKLARKQNLSLNSFINHWLRAAVTQDETIEWMKRQLGGRSQEKLVADFGKILNKLQPGEEPTLNEIEKAMGK
jgi:predicted transcriptional regulator